MKILNDSNQSEKRTNMKKTLTVNLGGTVFNIDDDAYRLLDNYLNNLRQHFRKEAGADEIVDDIERRISELFCEKQAGEPKVITLTDVEQVISRMGRPEEMEEAGENAPQDPGSSQSASIPRKRLFRDPDDKILGGVFSGLAAYFGLDVQLLRLLMFVLLFFSTGTLIIIYIICWIIIPQARTAADRLSMRGEAVTLENIGRTVTNGFERVSHGVNDYVASGKPRTFLQKVGDRLVTLIGLAFKAALVVLAIICSPFLLACGVGFVTLLFVGLVVLLGGGAAFVSLFPMMADAAFWVSPLPTLVMCIAGLFLVGIPLAAIVWGISHWAFHWRPMTTGLKWTLLALWVVSAACFVICIAMQGPDSAIYEIMRKNW